MSFETNFVKYWNLRRILRSWRWKSNSAPSACRASLQRYKFFLVNFRSSLSTDRKLCAIFLRQKFIFLLFDQISYFKALAFLISNWLSFLLERLDIGQTTNTVVCALHFFFCRSEKLGDWIARLGTFEGCVTRWSKKSPRSLAAKVGVWLCGVNNEGLTWSLLVPLGEDSIRDYKPYLSQQAVPDSHHCDTSAGDNT